MNWCKRHTVLDVDLIGAATLLGLLLAAWWLVVAPWRLTWQRYREMAAVCATTRQKLQDDVIAWEEFERELGRLERVVAEQAARIPHAESRGALLRQLTDTAKAADVELLNVVPQPEVNCGTFLVSDIRMTGRGRSQDFIRFLDALAQQNPYQAMRACTISRAAQTGQANCELAWTVRLYLLPPAADPNPARPGAAGPEAEDALRTARVNERPGGAP